MVELHRGLLVVPSVKRKKPWLFSEVYNDEEK